MDIEAEPLKVILWQSLTSLLHSAADIDAQEEEYYTPSEGELDWFDCLGVAGDTREQEPVEPAPAEQEGPIHPLLLGTEDVKEFARACGRFPYPKPVRTEEEAKLMIDLATSDPQPAHKRINHVSICKVWDEHTHFNIYDLVSYGLFDFTHFRKLF